MKFVIRAQTLLLLLLQKRNIQVKLRQQTVSQKLIGGNVLSRYASKI
jgi:hypothetical protein